MVDDVASGSAAASAVANSGAPSVAVTSAAPGSTKSAGCAPVFGYAVRVTLEAVSDRSPMSER